MVRKGLCSLATRARPGGAQGRRALLSAIGYSCRLSASPSTHDRSVLSKIFCKRGQRSSYSWSQLTLAASKLTLDPGRRWKPAPITSAQRGTSKRTDGGFMPAGMWYFHERPISR